MEEYTVLCWLVGACLAFELTAFVLRLYLWLMLTHVRLQVTLLRNEVRALLSPNGTQYPPPRKHRTMHG